jgi:hypothetical protein
MTGGTFGGMTEDPYRQRVKANYKFSDWAGRQTEGDADARVTDLRVRPGELKGWATEAEEELPTAERQRRVVRYVLSPERGGARLVSTLFECPSVADAHETLIDVVMTYMNPFLPRCEERGFEVGDVCFGSSGPATLLVLFARLNVVVEIQSTTPEGGAVEELARDLDSLIRGRHSTPDERA